MKTGLILEGGGMRGIYTAGVLDVFMEYGISFDGLVGVSAGGIHGCSYLSGQKGRSIRYYKKYCSDKRFMSVYNLFHGGEIVGREFCYKDIPEKLDVYDHEGFKASKTEFYVVCANVETGKSEYMRITDMKDEIDLIRASASLPYVSKIVEFGGKKLLDGGCTDSIPLKAFENMGFDKNVVILTRDESYRKKPIPKILPNLYYRKYPEFKEALLTRHEVYNAQVKYVEEKAASGEIFMLRPSEELTIGKLEHDPSVVEYTYNVGAKDARAKIEELKSWLGI